MKKIAMIAAFVAAGIVNANAQITAPASVQESINDKIARDNSSQSDQVSGHVITSTGEDIVVWNRRQTGFGLFVEGGGDYTAGVFSPLVKAGIVYRSPWGEVYGVAGFSQMERNEADENTGKKYNSYQVGVGGALKLLQDKKGKYLGDWRLSLAAEAVWQSFSHTESTGEFTLIDGSRNKVVFDETGGSFKMKAGLMWEQRLSKANALFLTVKPMVSYTNDPKIGGQISKVGGEITVGVKYIFGKKKYTPHGKVLKEHGVL